MTHLKDYFVENYAMILTVTAFLLCEILAHNKKCKSNSLFQLIYGFIRKEKQRLLPETQPETQMENQAAAPRDSQ